MVTLVAWQLRKEMVQKFDDAPECPMKVGDSVWAEWPRNGRWFRTLTAVLSFFR